MEEFLGVAIGAIIALIASIWTTHATFNRQTKLAKDAQLETRRTQRHEYLIWLMRELVQARTDYEAFLGQVSVWQDREIKEDDSVPKEHATTIGRAIAACLASGDAKLREIAESENGLTPYFVEGYKTRNRDKLHEALNRLGMLIQEISNL